MNMLIAVMGNPFNDVQTHEETYRNMQIVELIVEHFDLVNFKNLFKIKNILQYLDHNLIIYKLKIIKLVIQKIL